jgi:hypothetical protein
VLSLEHKAVVVNATSKRSELDYSVLDSLKRSPDVLHRGFGTELHLINGFDILSLANGFPVNFFDTSESVANSMIQFIPALLLASAGYVAQHELPPALHPVPRAIQESIESVYRGTVQR